MCGCGRFWVSQSFWYSCQILFCRGKVCVGVTDFGLARAFGIPVRFYSAEVRCVWVWQILD